MTSDEMVTAALRDEDVESRADPLDVPRLRILTRSERLLVSWSEKEFTTEESAMILECAAEPLKAGLGLGRCGCATELEDDIESLVDATEESLTS